MTTMTADAAVGGVVPDYGAKYGMRAVTPQHADSPLAQITGPAPAQVLSDHAWHPSSPLMAFGVLVGLTFGLLAFSASARVGRTRVAASVGDTNSGGSS